MFNLADAMVKEYRRQAESMDKVMSAHSAMAMYDMDEADQTRQKIMNEIMEDTRKHRELQDAGAKASVESHKLLKQQLAEQTEINQRLEHEFKMGAREAVITRRMAYWSLVVSAIGVAIAILAFFRGQL